MSGDKLSRLQKDCVAHLTKAANPLKKCDGCQHNLLTSQACKVRSSPGVAEKVGEKVKKPKGVDKPKPKTYVAFCHECGQEFLAKSLASRHADCPAILGDDGLDFEPGG